MIWFLILQISVELNSVPIGSTNCPVYDYTQGVITFCDLSPGSIKLEDTTCIDYEYTGLTLDICLVLSDQLFKNGFEHE